MHPLPTTRLQPTKCLTLLAIIALPEFSNPTPTTFINLPAIFAENTGYLLIIGHLTNQVKTLQSLFVQFSRKNLVDIVKQKDVQYIADEILSFVLF